MIAKGQENPMLALALALLYLDDGLIMILALTLALTVTTSAVLGKQQTDDTCSQLVFQLSHTLSDPVAMSALCHCWAASFMKLANPDSSWECPKKHRPRTSTQTPALPTHGYQSHPHAHFRVWKVNGHHSLDWEKLRWDCWCVSCTSELMKCESQGWVSPSSPALPWGGGSAPTEQRAKPCLQAQKAQYGRKAGLGLASTALLCWAGRLFKKGLPMICLSPSLLKGNKTDPTARRWS